LDIGEEQQRRICRDDHHIVLSNLLAKIPLDAKSLPNLFEELLVVVGRRIIRRGDKFLACSDKILETVTPCGREGRSSLGRISKGYALFPRGLLHGLR
jgi:hypothetical protein